MSDLRVRTLTLVGGGRTVTFNSGLSIVRGEIATGKTTLLRLIRGLLGSKPKNLPPETGQISALAGHIETDRGDFDILRPFVSTLTAPVDISGGGEALRLPAARSTKDSTLTYGDWLLDTLQIPNISVPSRRSSRSDSETTLVAVTINDWLNYCFLPGSEIDVSVFGHKEPFRDIKRKYVFEINYGIYDFAAAELQSTIRALNREEVRLQALTDAAARFLSGTQFSSRQDVQNRLQDALVERERLEGAGRALVSDSYREPGSEIARRQFLLAQTRLDALSERRASTEGQIKDLEDLAKDLKVQIQRTNRAMVAGELIGGMDFVVCPRCGNEIDDESRADVEHCRLCLQGVEPSLSRDAMVRELDRLHSQVAEVSEVLESRQIELRKIDGDRNDLLHLRDQLGHELEVRLGGFVSSSADRIADVSAATARATAEVRKLEEYMDLYTKEGVTAEELARVRAERDEATTQLTSGATSDALSLVADVEQRITDYLQRLRVPSLGKAKTRLSPATYLPEINGRSFDALSSQGLATLVNFAHALAHHTISIDHELPLPGLLVMDGLSNNIGSEDFDAERVADMYRLVTEVCEEYAPHLQVIIFDNDVPDFVSRDDIVLELQQTERLIR